MSDAELLVVRNCLAREGDRFKIGPNDTLAILARLSAVEAERDAAVARLNRDVAGEVRVIEEARTEGIAEGARRERAAVGADLRAMATTSRQVFNVSGATLLWLADHITATASPAQEGSE